MGIDLDTMRSDLRDATGTDDSDMPDTKTDLLLNRAYWALGSKFPYRQKEITATFPTVIGEERYNMPTLFESLRSLAIQDLDDLRWEPLDRIGAKFFDENSSSHTDDRAFPEKYLRDGECIKLLPIPDKVYTLRIRYLNTLADLVLDTDSPIIPQEWHEIIYFGGLWRAYLSFGDFIRGNATRRHQETLIAAIVPVEAKEEGDTSRIGVGMVQSSQDAEL